MTTDNPTRNPSANSKEKVSDGQIVLDAIRRIVRAVRASSKYAERTVGLSSAQIFVLQKLLASKKPLSINEVAEATLTHQSSASVVIAKLVQRNLIERTTCKTDMRSVLLNISKEGEYLLSKSPPTFQERLVVGLNEISEIERAKLVEGLQALIHKVGIQDEQAFMLLEDDIQNGSGSTENIKK